MNADSAAQLLDDNKVTREFQPIFFVVWISPYAGCFIKKPVLFLAKKYPVMAEHPV